MTERTNNTPGGDLYTAETLPATDPNHTLGRRNFMRGAFGLAIGATLGASASSDRPNNKASGESSVPETPASHVEQEDLHAEKSPISMLNFGSALAVSGVFVSEVYRNATEGKHHQPFGVKSFFRMISAETARLGALSLGNHDDIHQRDHEAKDIFEVSYPLAGALTLLAEATSHIEADEKALFDGYSKLIDEETGNNTDVIPDALTSSSEDWEKYYSNTENDIIRIAAQNRVIGAVISPIGTTYTSAELINAMNKRMSTALAKQAYAKRVHEAKQADTPLDQEQLSDFMTTSVAASDKHMHGKFGYVLNTMLNGGNIQGAGGIGDPPNFFYILRNGVGEWMKASAQGLATMNTAAYANDSVWLAQVLGVKDTRSIQAHLAKEVGAAAKDITMGALKTVTDPDYATLRFKKQGAMLDEILNNPGNGYSAEHIEQLRAMLGDINTTPFAYDWRGFMSAMKPVSSSKLGRLANFLSKSSANYKSAEYADAPGFMDENGMFNAQLLRPLLNNLREQAETESTHGLVERFVANFASEQKNNQIETIAKVLDGILEGANTGETNDVPHHINQLNSLTSLTGAVISDEKVNQIIADLEILVENDGGDPKDPDAKKAKQEADAVAFNNALDELTAGLGHLPEDSRKALVEFWARAIKADSVSGHTPTNGLGHASKEVLTALATQIPAANAIAITVRKLLESTPKDVPFEAKVGLVMGTAAGLSGVADNVVAYVYCEDVLLKEYQKEYGQDVFERTPGLKNQITRASLFTAIIGGALTKIGNGPNFKFQKHAVRPHLSQETGEYALSTHTDELAFKESFNPKAVANAVAHTALALKIIPKPQKQPKPKTDEKQLTGAH